MRPLKFAVIGTGFWSNYQISAWNEIDGVELVALCNRTRAKAELIARKFHIEKVYTSVEELLKKETLDFIDIISNLETHGPYTLLVAGARVNVICQKPMAISMKEAETMVSFCQQNHVKFFVHENFRFQAPIRALKKILDEGIIGRPFKARVSFCSAFPVYDNQPFLKEQEYFIISDIGSHVLDVCRFLFGEAKILTCLTQKVNSGIRGEDVANVLMEMDSGLHCLAEMSYASLLEKESFPQTLVLVEGEAGSVNLTNDFTIKITTKKGTDTSVIKPHYYSWADPDYAVVHSSIVDCNKNILQGMLGGQAETTGEDNLKTMNLVWSCYESARSKQAVFL